jgi:hypothetical protein
MFFGFFNPKRAEAPKPKRQVNIGKGKVVMRLKNGSALTWFIEGNRAHVRAGRYFRKSVHEVFSDIVRAVNSSRHFVNWQDEKAIPVSKIEEIELVEVQDHWVEY